MAVDAPPARVARSELAAHRGRDVIGVEGDAGAAAAVRQAATDAIAQSATARGDARTAGRGFPVSSGPGRPVNPRSARTSSTIVPFPQPNLRAVASSFSR